MRTSLLLLATLACSGDKDKASSSAVEISDIVAAPAPAMGTVLEISWTTDVPAMGFVRFTAEGDAARSTKTDVEGTSHAHTLVGVPPQTDVLVELVHLLDGEEVVGHSETVTAGALSGLAMTVEGSSDRFVALTTIDGVTDESTIVVIDPKGRVVWSYVDHSGFSVFRAHIAKDGSGIIYAATLVGGKPNPDSKLVYVPWNGQAPRDVPVPYLAHDFVEHDDGTIVSLAYEFRDVPALGGGVEGNRLVRVSPDGTIEENVWSAWDCYDPEVNESIDLEHGWIHANALDYDEAADRYLVGMRNLTTIAQVDLATKSCDWGFGGSGGTVDIDGPDFFHQHQFDRIPGGLLVFDNDGAGFESRILEFSFDEEAGTAEHVRTITSEIYSFILGDVHRIDDSDTLITWAVPHRMERIDADGQVTWKLTADDNALIFGFTEVALDPGRPDFGVLH